MMSYPFHPFLVDQKARGRVYNSNLHNGIIILNPAFNPLHAQHQINILLSPLSLVQPHRLELSAPRSLPWLCQCQSVSRTQFIQVRFQGKTSHSEHSTIYPPIYRAILWPSAKYYGCRYSKLFHRLLLWRKFNTKTGDPMGIHPNMVKLMNIPNIFSCRHVLIIHIHTTGILTLNTGSQNCDWPDTNA